jgi:Fumarate reductase flavoprotein C-term
VITTSPTSGAVACRAVARTVAAWTQVPLVSLKFSLMRRQREESRGAHQRTDFPARDDGRFLAHSLVYRQPDGSSRVEYLPVTITRRPPGKRVYGR